MIISFNYSHVIGYIRYKDTVARRRTAKAVDSFVFVVVVNGLSSSAIRPAKRIEYENPIPVFMTRISFRAEQPDPPSCFWCAKGATKAVVE
jgi:hypothetical protein